MTFPQSLADEPASTTAQWPGQSGTVQYSEGVDVGYRWYDSKSKTPLYPFGFGLSYTSWELGNATLERDGDELVVRATLANTGDRDGADVVQVYGGRPADPSRPARRLVGFARVEVAAGQTRTAEIRIPLHRLQVREHGAWTLVPGTYVLSVARHSADLGAQDVIWDG